MSEGFLLLKLFFSRAPRPRTEPGSADPGPHLFCAILQKSKAFLQNGTEGWPSSPLTVSDNCKFMVKTDAQPVLVEDSCVAPMLGSSHIAYMLRSSASVRLAILSLKRVVQWSLKTKKINDG